jgi:hypothetical protein
MKRILLGATVVLAGCASVDFHEIKQEKASQRPYHEERDGLFISCEPITKSDLAVYHLGIDLPGYDVLPVVVYLENRGTAETFTFLPEDLLLLYEDGRRLKQVPWKDVYDDVCYSYWPSVPGFFLLIFPGFLIIGSAASANEDIANTYDRLSLDQVRLPPGERAQGVVFLRPEAGDWLRREGLSTADLRFMFQRSTGSRTVPVEVLYHLYTEK